MSKTNPDDKPYPMEQMLEGTSVRELLEQQGIDEETLRMAKVPSREGPPPRELHNTTGEEYGCYFVIGDKRKGKSTWVEERAETRYKKDGFFVFDWFDAADFESCYWGIRSCKTCRRPIRYDEEVCPDCKMKPKDAHPVIIVVPEYVNMKTIDPNFELFHVDEDDHECLEAVVKRALRTKNTKKGTKVVALASGLFKEDHLYRTLAEWMKQWQILNRDTFRMDTLIIIREAADVAFSRGASSGSEYAKDLKRGITSIVRKGGHCRTTIFFDTQRYMELDLGARGNVPYVIMKKHSAHNMPEIVKNLNKRIDEQRSTWYFDKGIHPDKINKARPEITHLRKQEFYVLFDDGDYRLGINGFPSFHHKSPKDYFDLLTDTTYDQEMFTLERKSKFATIRQVPKGALLDLTKSLHNNHSVSIDDLAKMFDRKKATIKAWVI